MIADKPCWVFDLDGTLTEAVHDFDLIRARMRVPAQLGILEWLAALPPSEREPHERWLDEHEYELAGSAVAAARTAPGSTAPAAASRRNARRFMHPR